VVALIASLLLAYLSARLVVALSGGARPQPGVSRRSPATSPEPEMVLG